LAQHLARISTLREISYENVREGVAMRKMKIREASGDKPAMRVGCGGQTASALDCHTLHCLGEFL
jgi:hypothetical protein